MFCYSIFININYRIGKGQYSTDSGNWQTVSPLAKVSNHSPLQFFFLLFNTRLDYICAFIFFPNDLCLGARPRHVGGGPQQETDHPSDPFTPGVFSFGWIGAS